MRTLVQVIEELNDNIARNPNSAEAYYKRAVLFVDVEGIMSEEERKQFAEYYLEKGEEFFLEELEKFEKDIDPLGDLNKAISLNPNYTDAYYQRGVVYIEDRDIENALSDFDKAISLDATYKLAYMEKAKICSRDQKDEALAYLDKVLELDPEYGAAYRLRIDVYRSIGDYENFLIACQWWLDRNSEDADVYAKRSHYYYYKAEEYDKALEDILNAICFEKTVVRRNIHTLHAVDVYLKLSRADDALSILQTAKRAAYKIIESADEESEESADVSLSKKQIAHILGKIANIYESEKKYDEALAYADKCLDLPLPDIYYFYFKIEIYTKLDRYAEALADYNKMLELEKGAKKPDSWVERTRRLMVQLAKSGKIKMSDIGLPEEEEYDDDEPTTIWGKIKEFFGYY